MNITVEEDDIVSDSLLANPSFGVNYTYVVNLIPGATYTITVSAVNQVGQNESTVTVETCKCITSFTLQRERKKNFLWPFLLHNMYGVGVL